MAQQLQIRRGTTAQNEAFTGAISELSVDTERRELRVHDGATPGGTPLARAPFATVAELLANTETWWPEGYRVTAGAAGGGVFGYTCAASAATDHHLTTAGGVKLYADRDASGRYNIRAFGAVGDGSTDDSAAIQRGFDFGKANPGITLVFPDGAWRVETSIDCTYAGVAAGLTSGYYGFIIEGTDPHNCYFSGATTGTPMIDLTGKPRMTFRNIGFANYSDGAHNPSCLLLLARNTTNSYAGGHVFDRCNFRGYVTQVVVQTASSEVNKWVNVSIEPYSNTPGLELTEQIETTVNSEYIDLSAHTFSGGNTRHTFLGCEFNSVNATSGTHALSLGGIDDSVFLGCYSNSKQDATILFSADCDNVQFIDHRDESGSGCDYFMQVASAVTLTGVVVSGRASRPFRAEDTSALIRCDVKPTFMATDLGVTVYSFDAYDCTDSDVRGMTNSIRVRNSARGTRLWDYKISSEWSLPTADLTQPEFYGLAYSGGSANYRRRMYSTASFERRQHGRLDLTSIALRVQHEADLNATNYPSGFTPDLDDGSNYSFIVTGNVTINAPANADLGAGDTKGQILILTISQDGTGGHTVTLPSNYDLQGATIPTTALGRITLAFVYADTSGGPKWMRMN